MTRDLLLAIDCGTQSVRALLFDLAGNLLLKARVPIRMYYSEQPGWAEQEADCYWSALCEACRELRQMDAVGAPGGETGGLWGRIAGVALACQRGTIVNVDQKGAPLRPAIVWPDQRRTEGLKPLGGKWGLAFRLAGMSDTVAYVQAEAEVNWIKTHQPEIWERTHKYLLLSGYLTYRLTGRFADSAGCQVAYLPFDAKGLSWSAPGDWKWQAVPIEKERLPELVPPSGQIGEITAAASQATGIPCEIPLIAAGADKACEVIGAGCLEPQIACLSYGTTATLNTTHRRYLEVIPLIPPFPAAIPGAYTVELAVKSGFWMVTWFKEEFGQVEQQKAREIGVETEALFDELAAGAPAGSMGLVLQPYWSPGLRIPGPEALGAVIGWRDMHTRAHFYRSILEGIAYELRQGKERSEKRSGVPITELRVVGGGSQSEAAMQITADVFGLPAARPHLYEASGLGAAIDAAVGLGLHLGFESAVNEMTHPGRVFEPNPAARDVYDELYHRVYQPMYGRLKPFYDAIRGITMRNGRLPVNNAG